VTDIVLLLSRILFKLTLSGAVLYLTSGSMVKSNISNLEQEIFIFPTIKPSYFPIFDRLKTM